MPVVAIGHFSTGHIGRPREYTQFLPRAGNATVNRLALVQERTRLLWRLEFLASVVLDVFCIADSLKEINVPDAEDRKIRDSAVARLEKMAGTALAEIRDAANPEAPFSAMARAWTKDFMAALP